MAVLACACFCASSAFSLDPSKAITQYVVDGWQMEAGLPSTFVRAIAQTPDGYLWLATEKGLVRFDGARFTTFDRRTTPQLASHHITEILPARDGSLWVGTRGGLSRLRDGRFTSLTTKDGLASNVILVLRHDRTGNLWVGTFAGLNRIGPDGRIDTFSTAAGLSHDLVSALAEDADGNLWVGTYGGGLNRFRDGRFTRFTRKEGLVDDLVLALHVDTAGSLWIGTDDGGLVRLKDGAFTAITTREGLSHDAVRAVLGDADGTIWIATHGGGLNRLRGPEVRVFGRRDGLSSDLAFSLWRDRAGLLWVGTYRGGLNRFDGARFTTFAHPDLPRSAGRQMGIFSAPTDAEGAYRLDGLPSASFFVLAVEGTSYFTNTYIDEVYGGVPCPSGECDVTRGRLVHVTVGEETGGIDFRLDRGGKIAGRVTDATTAEPLFFATVSIFDAQTLRFLDDTVTDAAGFYVSREALPKGSYFAVASSFAHQAELYADVPCVDFCNAVLGKRVKIKPPEVTEGIDFALDPLP